MAIYTWKCPNCENEQEVERSMAKSNIPPDGCNSCDRLTMEHDVWVKVIKPSKFILAGGGWYKDGYQKGDK